MKINSKLLALCVFHPSVWGTAAFFVQAPKSRGQVLLSSFNYGGKSTSVNGGSVSEKTTSSGVPGGVSSAPSSTSSNIRQSTPTSTSPRRQDRHFSENIWDSATPVVVQGGSLRTWSLTDAYVEAVQVVLKTEGRPLNADVDLWHGPDNTPQKMRVYLEDGSDRPFSAVIATPRGQNAIAIRNTGHLEFPMEACVAAGVRDGSTGLEAVTKGLPPFSQPQIVQGGAIRTYPFEPAVASVQVLLKTDGRPLNARIELLQGPNNIKQVIELYTEDGMERPFVAVVETPGSGNVVRIVNSATMEYPLSATVEPYLVDSGPQSSFRVSEDMGGLRMGGESNFAMGGGGGGGSRW